MEQARVWVLGFQVVHRLQATGTRHRHERKARAWVVCLFDFGFLRRTQTGAIHRSLSYG